jgi:hypothetical protein
LNKSRVVCWYLQEKTAVPDTKPTQSSSKGKDDGNDKDSKGSKDSKDSKDDSPSKVCGGGMWSLEWAEP